MHSTLPTVTLTIDGKKVQAETGQTVLEAAQQANSVACHAPKGHRDDVSAVFPGTCNLPR